MSSQLSLTRIEPTVCLRESGGRLQQLVRVTVQNSGGPVGAGLKVTSGGVTRSVDLGRIAPGECVQGLYVEELAAPATLEFTLQAAGQAVDRRVVPWQPPPHYTVHVVQRSHHDVGYTDLASLVLPEMAGYLDAAIDMAAATDDYPEDARFRLTIEQVWSLWEFLRTAPEGRREKMVELLRSGRFEMTAFFGNMTPELCGSETLARSLYHAARLRREYGLPPLVSAEHNDVPGLSWGQAEVLLAAGIKLFCPGLPYYWSWNRELNLQSFWDEAVLFPHGTPGAFWWEAPSGGRLLLWHSGAGAAGSARADLPGLPERLAELAAQNWPYTVLRWPCVGAYRDNAPYLMGYAETVKQWNERWAYPHLICSTNARFYADFAAQVPADLPVFRGELPGQDYPSGATSTAAATAGNRGNHAALPATETLAVTASSLTAYPYPADTLFSAHEEVLWHDEHTWGHTWPCGPGNLASETEKATHAYRAAALSHDVSSKALAQLADQLALPEPGFYLCVFNSQPAPRTGLVRVPLREIDNTSTSLRWVPPAEAPEGVGYWEGVWLLTRGHLTPPAELLAGGFELLDMDSGKTVPCELVDLAGPQDTVPFAAQRAGVTTGSVCGCAKVPSGLGRDLCFTAREVPACGYRAYRLLAAAAPPLLAGYVHAEETAIENEFYRVEADATSGLVRSLYDKVNARELVDPTCPHTFGAVVVRDACGPDELGLEGGKVRLQHGGPAVASLLLTGKAPGLPQVTQTITLYEGLPEVHFATRLLKDATPLQEISLAFPFAAHHPEWRYEGNFSVLDPARDFLPGAYWNRLPVQNWVRLTDGDYHLLWSSLDAPIVSLAGLWPDYHSPAHRCHLDERLQRPPVDLGALARTGWIYSHVMQNNFGTNFSCAQVADVLFRYVLTTRGGTLTDAQSALWARQAVCPMMTIFTDGSRPGMLPPAAEFLRVESADVVLLACKRAEDGRGLVLRLWNLADRDVTAPVSLPLVRIASVQLTNLVEEDLGPVVPCSTHQFSLPIPPHSTATVRVTLQEALP